MDCRAFGTTGLQVSVLGFGAGHIGNTQLDERDVGRLLHAVLDSGVTLLDTARGYWASEERIGRHLAHRRSEFVLSTKVGYGIPGLEPWTYACVQAGVDEALKLMRTDYLDVVHLHSCPIEILMQGDVIQALQQAQQAGKVRVIAYSGENEPLAWAVQSGYFGAIQTSVNVCEQRGLSTIIADAAQRGMGVIAKRPLANAFWRFEQLPVGDYSEEYWRRWHQMGLRSPLPMNELAVRFAAYAPGVSSCIVGTASPHHWQDACDGVAPGVLPENLLQPLQTAFAQHGSQWFGQI